MTTEKRHALHIIHGYNEPFLSLSNLYSRALQAAGWRVTAVYLTGAADNEIRAQTVADDVIFFDTPDSAMKGLKAGLLLRVRKLLTANTQLIIAQRYKPLYLALIGSIGRDIPVLGVAHAFGVLKSANRRRLLHFFSSRLVLAGVSDAVSGDMRKHDNTLRIVTLHNGIDVAAREPQLLTRTAARKKLGIADNAFAFGNVGRLHADKDQATLIRAFARIASDYPAAKLLLVGKGKREADYRALVEQLQLQDRVLLTGPLPAAPTLFPAFDAYVSASDREPFGIVLTEAMLARIPAISTDCGGAPEVLGERALYFSSKDDATLAQQMEKLMQMTISERQEIGENLYQRLQQKFAFPPFCQRLDALLQTMVRTTGTP